MANGLAALAARPAIDTSAATTISAIETGKQSRYIEEDRARDEETRQLAGSAFDAWSTGRQSAYQAAMGKLASVNPDEATKLNSLIGSLDRTNFVDAGFHLYNAARFEDISTQDKSLERARDALGVREDHPFIQGINDILAMPVETEEDKKQRDSAIFGALEMAQAWGAFGGFFQEREKLGARGKESDIAARRLLFDMEKEQRIAQDEDEKLDLARRKHEHAKEFGLVPSGWTRKGDRLIPERGSEDDQIRRKEQAKLARKYSNEINTIDRQMGQLQNLFDKADWTTTGFLGSFLSLVPGSEARDFREAALTIKANIGFDRLQQMRAESPTGGALGQVAIQELEALQASLASLEQSQSPQQFKSNLQTVMKHYERLQTQAKKYRDTVQKADSNDLWDWMGEAATQEQFTRENPASPQSQEDFDALAPGSFYIDPDDGRLYTK